MIDYWSQPYWIEKRSITLALIDARRYIKGRVLDVGCGNKPYLQLFRERIDIYVGMELFKTEFRADVYGNGLALPFKDSVFDTVLLISVLEHMPEPGVAFQEVERVLVPGGSAIFIVPQSWGLHEEPDDYYRYTKYGLYYLAGKSNLQVEYIKARRSE